ncbi:hypothetical protein [Corynebacterium choanae]|uniref:SCP domain-containing protein n=1 Tax=Corynebacterium choanae TaxID=1862358 RepID=A0A3G6JBP4_9CORY|nr:hypothetical protein [Corynebacterium choanae]AZA13564.1 hypothetical protein CCHOA_05820 [Corynebacterium choanae]
MLIGGLLRVGIPIAVILALFSGDALSSGSSAAATNPTDPSVDVVKVTLSYELDGKVVGTEEREVVRGGLVLPTLPTVDGGIYRVAPGFGWNAFSNVTESGTIHVPVQFVPSAGSTTDKEVTVEYVLGDTVVGTEAVTVSDGKNIELTPPTGSEGTYIVDPTFDLAALRDAADGQTVRVPLVEQSKPVQPPTPQQYTVTINYVDNDGQVVKTEQQTVAAGKNATLNLPQAQDGSDREVADSFDSAVLENIQANTTITVNLKPVEAETPVEPAKPANYEVTVKYTYKGEPVSSDKQTVAAEGDATVTLPTAESGATYRIKPGTDTSALQKINKDTEVEIPLEKVFTVPVSYNHHDTVVSSDTVEVVEGESITPVAPTVGDKVYVLDPAVNTGGTGTKQPWEQISSSDPVVIPVLLKSSTPPATISADQAIYTVTLNYVDSQAPEGSAPLKTEQQQVQHGKAATLNLPTNPSGPAYKVADSFDNAVLQNIQQAKTITVPVVAESTPVETVQVDVQYIYRGTKLETETIQVPKGTDAQLTLPKTEVGAFAIKTKQSNIIFDHATGFQYTTQQELDKLKNVTTPQSLTVYLDVVDVYNHKAPAGKRAEDFTQVERAAAAEAARKSVWKRSAMTDYKSQYGTGLRELTGGSYGESNPTLKKFLEHFRAEKATKGDIADVWTAPEITDQDVENLRGLIDFNDRYNAQMAKNISEFRNEMHQPAMEVMPLTDRQKAMVIAHAVAESVANFHQSTQMSVDLYKEVGAIGSGENLWPNSTHDYGANDIYPEEVADSWFLNIMTENTAFLYGKGTTGHLTTLVGVPVLNSGSVPATKMYGAFVGLKEVVNTGSRYGVEKSLTDLYWATDK